MTTIMTVKIGLCKFSLSTHVSSLGEERGVIHASSPAELLFKWIYSPLMFPFPRRIHLIISSLGEKNKEVVRVGFFPNELMHKWKSSS